MDVSNQPLRWLRSYWDEEDVTFFFEVDGNGWVLRQVEVRGPQKTPVVAASLAEWPDADRDGISAVRAYEMKYGALADQPITTWDEGFPHVDIDRTDFEVIWERARAHLEASR